jgi:hypothetical protein
MSQERRKRMTFVPSLMPAEARHLIQLEPDLASQALSEMMKPAVTPVCPLSEIQILVIGYPGSAKIQAHAYSLEAKEPTTGGAWSLISSRTVI